MATDSPHSHRASRSLQTNLAIAMTLCWVVMLVLTVAVRTTLVPILTATASVGLAWAWAIIGARPPGGPELTLRELKALSPTQFEAWVAARFAERGYQVRLTGMPGDHGVDLLAVRGKEVAVIQCKHYRRRTVGEPVLRDLYGAMHGLRAHRAYLVTTGRLTGPARRWIEGKPITVWEGPDLTRLLLPPGLQAAPRNPAAAALTRLACPRCGAALAHRRDRQTGEHVLACSSDAGCGYAQRLPR